MKIEISLGVFLSLGDEKRFFQGLSSIKGVRRLIGHERNLIITLNIGDLNKERVLDLISLLWRYQIPLHPLNIIANNKRFLWLSESHWYWHKNMF